MLSLIIRARQVRESDANLNLNVPPFSPLSPSYVAWVEGEELDCYDKNTGRTEAEAIGSLLIGLSYVQDSFIIKDIILEDNE